MTLLWTVFRYGFLEEWPKANLWRISRPQSYRWGRGWSFLGHRKSMCEARHNSLPDFNDESLVGISKMWERFHIGIIPSPHYKEPGAYFDDFWSWLFPKLQGMEPGEKELSVLVIRSISPNEVVCMREQWQSYFEILLLWGKSQWHVRNSFQFLSTPVSGPLYIARKRKKYQTADH